MERAVPGLGARRQLTDRLRWAAQLVMVIWAVELANLLTGHRLCALGIRPRTLVGLLGIPLSPFLHYGIVHTMANTVPLFVLGFLVSLHGRRMLLEVSLFVILLGGAAVWLLGRSGTIHVGSSPVVFGYMGFVLASGWFLRDVKSILVAVVTLMLYGGLLWGMLPLHAAVSWEGHLFGFLAGIMGARLAADDIRARGRATA